MAGKPGAHTVAALLAVVDEEMSAHAAALRFGISPITLYKSVFYKAWRAAGFDPHARQAVKNDLIARMHEIKKWG